MKIDEGFTLPATLLSGLDAWRIGKTDRSQLLAVKSKLAWLRRSWENSCMFEVLIACLLSDQEELDDLVEAPKTSSI